MLEVSWPLMLIGGLIGGAYGFWRENKAGGPLGWKLFGIFAGGFIGATLLVVGALVVFMVMWGMSI